MDQLVFTGYRLPPTEERRDPPPVYLGLRHWFEAEKFRDCEPLLHLEMLHQPTVKEAVKLSTRHRARWRMDWVKVRVRALACGLVYASRADQGSARWSGGVDEILALLSPLSKACSPNGLPDAFLRDVAAEYLLLRDSTRVAVIGARGAPKAAVGKKVNALHRKHSGRWTLVQWQGRHASWKVHDWAVNQLVPVDYLGEPDDRLNDASIALVASSCSNVLVYERRGGKGMDRVLRTLRGCRRAAIELELYDAGAADLATPLLGPRTGPR